MKLKNTLYLPLVMALLLGGCLGKNYMTHEDFTTKGFVNDDVFQSVLDFPPDKKARGLVNMRASSSKNFKGEARVNYFVLEILTDYCIKNNIDRNYITSSTLMSNISIIKSRLRDDLQSYLSDGDIAHKFYSKRNSLTVIHRIQRKKFRGELNSINVAAYLIKE